MSSLARDISSAPRGQPIADIVAASLQAYLATLPPNDTTRTEIAAILAALAQLGATAAETALATGCWGRCAR